MIRFYYHNGSGGSNPQFPQDENPKPTLSAGYQFLSQIYYKWWMMLIEGIGVILLGAYAGLLAYDTWSDTAIPVPFSFIQILGMFLAVFGIVYILLAGQAAKHQDSAGLLRTRGVIEAFIGAMLMITAPLAYITLLPMISFFSLIAGFSLIFTNRYSGAKRVIRLIVGLVLIFMSTSFFTLQGMTYIYTITAAILIVFGAYLIYNCLGFRKAVMEVEKEERGFTDYTIE